MKSLVFSALCVLLAFAAPSATVDFDETIGAIKPVNGVGQPPMRGMPRRGEMFRFLKEAGIPYSRLHDVGGPYGRGVFVDVPNVFRDFDADENDPKNYFFAYTDTLVTKLVEAGVEPFYRLGVTIENNVEAGWPPVNILPPKDYAKWARVCEHVIRHYTEGWANGFRYKITYWEIWNEPENNPDKTKNPMWRGDFQSYCDFYGVVAPYLKGKFPHLKIGGYASCGFYAGVGSGEVKAANSSPRLEHFVACAQTFLRQAYAKNWPLDFFSFHSYSSPREALRQIDYADELLRNNGFAQNSKCERVFDEWLPAPSEERLGTAEQAADVAAMLVGLQKSTVSVACVYDARCGQGAYSPLFDPVTYERRKAYWAFMAFNELRKLGVEVEMPETPEHVYALGAADGKGQAAVMVANVGDRPWTCDFAFPGWRMTSALLTDKFADYGERTWSGTVAPHSFWLLKFAADGWRSADETAAIQARIDAASAAGGGRVSLAPGVHRIGLLALRSNVELHLEKGAKLLASRNPLDYHVPPEGFDEQEWRRRGGWKNAAIRIVNAENAALTGEEGCEIDGRNGYDSQGEEGFRGNHLVMAYRSRNVRIEGVTLRDAGNFAVYVQDCTNVECRALGVYGGHDALDFFGCGHVRVEGCLLHSGDDCVAGNGNTDLVVEDCDLNTACSMFRVGGNNLRFRRCRGTAPAEHPHRWGLSRAVKKLRRTPPGVGRRTSLAFFTYFSGSRTQTPADDVLFEDCSADGVEEFIHYNFSGNERWQKGKGLRGVTFRNVKVTNLKRPLCVYTQAGLPLTMAIEDCELSFREPVGEFIRGSFFGTLRADGLKVQGVKGPLLRTWKDAPKIDFKKTDGVGTSVEKGEGAFRVNSI